MTLANSEGLKNVSGIENSQLLLGVGSITHKVHK